MNFPSDELWSLRQRRRAGEKGGHKRTVFLQQKRKVEKDWTKTYLPNDQYSQVTKTAPISKYVFIFSFFFTWSSRPVFLKSCASDRRISKESTGPQQRDGSMCFFVFLCEIQNGSTWQLDSVETNWWQLNTTVILTIQEMRLALWPLWVLSLALSMKHVAVLDSSVHWSRFVSLSCLTPPRRPSVAVTVMCLGTSQLVSSFPFPMGTHRHTGQPAWPLHSLGTLEIGNPWKSWRIRRKRDKLDLRHARSSTTPFAIGQGSLRSGVIKCALLHFLCLTESKFYMFEVRLLQSVQEPLPHSLASSPPHILEISMISTQKNEQKTVPQCNKTYQKQQNETASHPKSKCIVECIFEIC